MQRRWQDGCRIWPLLARGFGHTLYVVPGAVCTTAHWMCQALIHVRVKLAIRVGRHGSKEQTLATPKAPARWLGGRARRPAGRNSTADAAGTGSAGIVRAGGAPTQRPVARSTTPAPGCPRPSGDRSPANSGRGHPARSGAVLPVGPPPDRDHRRPDVRAADPGVNCASRPSPGVSFSREARNPIA